MPNDAHVRAMQEVGLSDPEVKAAANRLALKALAHAEMLLDHGNPQVKIRVIHSLLPAISKFLREEEADTRFEDLKAQMFRMFKEMGTPKELMEAQEM